MSKKITKMTKKTIVAFLVFSLVLGFGFLFAPGASADDLAHDAFRRALASDSPTTATVPLRMGGHVNLTGPLRDIALRANQFVDLGGYTLTVDVSITNQTPHTLTLQGDGKVYVLGNGSLGSLGVSIHGNVTVVVKEVGATIGGGDGVISLRNNAELHVSDGVNIGGATSSLVLNADETASGQGTTLKLLGTQFINGTRTITPRGGTIKFENNITNFITNWAGAESTNQDVTFYGPGTLTLGSNLPAIDAHGATITVTGGATLAGTVAQLGGVRNSSLVLDEGNVNFLGVPAGTNNFGRAGTSAFVIGDGGGRINVFSAAGLTSPGTITLMGANGSHFVGAPPSVPPSPYPRSLVIGGNGRIDAWNDTALHQHLDSITLRDSVILQSNAALRIAHGKTLTIEAGATLLNATEGLTVGRSELSGRNIVPAGVLINRGTLAMANQPLTLEAGDGANLPSAVVTNNGSMLLGNVTLGSGNGQNVLGASLVNNGTISVDGTLTVNSATEHAQAGAASLVNNENATLTVGTGGSVVLDGITFAGAPAATFVNDGTVAFTGSGHLNVQARNQPGTSRPTFTNNGLVQLSSTSTLATPIAVGTNARGLVVNSADGTIISRSSAAETVNVLTDATFQNRGVVAYGYGVGTTGRLGALSDIRGDGIVVVVGPANPSTFTEALGANWNYITLYGNNGRFERLDNAEQLLVGGTNAFNINLGQLAPFNLLPTRANFELTGWNTRMDGTGSPVEIGGTVQIIADTPIPGQPVPNVYQAQWAAVAVDPGPGREWATMTRGEVAAHFIDVRAAAWYTPYVGWALASRITTGRPEGSRTFQPARILDRATFVTFLWRMAGTPAPSGRVPTFTDQATIPTWAADALAWASSANVRIARGFDTDNTLRPLADVSRQEMAVFLHRFVGYMGLNDSVPAGGIPAGYVDRGQVISWARGAVAWAVDNGVMGVNTDSLSPTDSANRAEAVTMLQRVAIGFRIPAPNLG